MTVTHCNMAQNKAMLHLEAVISKCLQTRHMITSSASTTIWCLHWWNLPLFRCIHCSCCI